MTLLAGRRAGSLESRLTALDEVLELGRDRLDPQVVAVAEQIAGRAGDRLRFGPGHTVVALAGATGSGKSSLFNALVGQDLSEVGLRRPTTGTALAAVHGPDSAGELLDWLQVPRRHELVREPTGLVLLDLPDVDSVERRHRAGADRLIERVDLMVWVLDPQKYADAALHEGYLAPLADHAGVMLVVLNQVDRLSAEAVAACRGDLRRLLDSEGLGAVPVLPVSARTGAGLDELRAELGRRVSAKRAAAHRLEADLTRLAASLDGSYRLSKDRSGTAIAPADRQALVSALADAAGADVVAAAVATSHRLRGRRATGWPPTRWIARWRLDPTRRFRLREHPSELVRTSLPGPSAVQRARVGTALRDLGERASQGLPAPWPALVRTAATSSRAQLPELLDRAVAGADLGVGRAPRWWRVVGGLQTLALTVAVAGLLWLTALFAVAWLQLPDPPLPHWGPVPVPTVMLAGGLLAGILLALLSVPPTRVGARRAGTRARQAVIARLEQLADESVVTPVQAELQAHHRLARSVAAVRGS